VNAYRQKIFGPHRETDHVADLVVIAMKGVDWKQILSELGRVANS
jgi:hypothetical protein